MLKLIGRRLALGLATLIVVSGLIFSVTEVMPRDLAANILGRQATPESMAAIRAELDLGQPSYLRYAAWVADAARGDLGRSLANKRPVLDVIGGRLGNTMFLVFYAAIIAVPLAAMLGILSVIYRGGIFERMVNAVSLAAISLPHFFIGYVLILFLSVQLRWFPSIAAIKAEQSFFEHLYATFLPMLTLILVVVAHMTRMTRSSVLAAMSVPYVETALLKGLSRQRIVLHHALPNAMAPLIHGMATNLAYLIVGIVMVEAVFTFDGFGRLMVDAVGKHDIPVVQGCALIFAILFIGLRLMADVLSILSNPRLRHAQ